MNNSAERARDGGSRGLAAWLADKPLETLGLLGVLAFGLLRFAYGQFYGRLGVSPEDVGLGYAEILGQAAVGLLLIFLLLAGLSLAYLVVFWFWALLLGRFWGLGRRIAHDVRQEPRLLRWYLPGLAILALATVVFVVLPDWVAWTVIAVVLLFGVVAAARDRRRDDPMRGGARPSDPGGDQPASPAHTGAVPAADVRAAEQAAPEARPSAHGKPVLAGWRWAGAGTAAAVLTSGVVLVAAGVADARAVGRGQPVGPFDRGWLPFPPWSAQRVEARWLDPGVPGRMDLADRDCLMLLGDADGLAVFYDAESDQPMRIPATSIITVTTDSQPVC